MITLIEGRAPGTFSGRIREAYERVVARREEGKEYVVRYDERRVLQLTSSRGIPLLLEFIEDPRPSLLTPPERQTLTDPHPSAACPLCGFEQRRSFQVIDELVMKGGVDSLLTTVTREYAPEHVMVLSKDPYPQAVLEDRALRTILSFSWHRGPRHQTWFNSKGAGAGIYTHFHAHSSRLHAALWQWVERCNRAVSLVDAGNAFACNELTEWPARARLYESRDLDVLVRALMTDIADLNGNNIPSVLLARVSVEEMFQVILGIRTWSDAYGSTVLLTPPDGPLLWYPRLGAPGVPGGVIYAVGDPCELSDRQKGMIADRFLTEMHGLSNWTWRPL